MTFNCDRRAVLEKSVRIIRSRQETRERILLSTQSLLDRNSAQDFQIRDVARVAGVSASLIIQYFNSKNELVFEAALRRLDAVNADLAARLAATPPTALADVLEMFFTADWAISHIIRDLMALSWWWSPADEARVAEVFRPRDEAIRASLTASGQTGDSAEIRAVREAYFAGFRSGCVTKAAREEVLAGIQDRIAQLI